MRCSAGKATLMMWSQEVTNTFLDVIGGHSVVTGSHNKHMMIDD